MVAPTSQSTENETPPPVTIDKHPRASLSECGLARDGELGPLDVAIAIDASRSTVDPSGSDVDADGDIGKFFFGRFKAGSTDPEDSWLYAEVRAVRAVVNELAGGDVRFSIVAFSGIPPHATKPTKTEHAVIEAPLTGNSADLEAALGRVIDAGSQGHTRFSAGMNLANQTLTEGSAPRKKRRIVLFISESPNPSIPNTASSSASGASGTFDPAMKDAALAAVDAHIVYHTFGLGGAADAPDPHALGRIGKATGGRFHPVPDALLLHCKMAHALLPPLRMIKRLQMKPAGSEP